MMSLTALRVALSGVPMWVRERLGCRLCSTMLSGGLVAAC